MRQSMGPCIIVPTAEIGWAAQRITCRERLKDWRATTQTAGLPVSSGCHRALCATRNLPPNSNHSRSARLYSKTTINGCLRRYATDG